MKQLSAIIKTINSYVLKHKVLLLLIIAYYINILGIGLLNGNYICQNGVCGIGIVNSLFHDPIWHAALAAVGFNTIPFQMPVYAGMPLYGYHFLFDLLLSFFTKLGIDPLFAYYKIATQLFFIPFVYLAFYYALKINKSLLFVFAYIFFLFFGGTASYVPYFLHTGSVLTANDMLLQLNTLGLSPNIGFSFIIFLAVLIITQNKKLTAWNVMALNASLFLSMGMKFYGGLVLFIYLNLLNVLLFLKKDSLKKLCINGFFYALTFVIAMFVFYNPLLTLKSGSAFIFSPFTLVHPMIESPEMYPMPGLVLARYSLIDAGQFSPRLLMIELFTTAIFLFHYFGTFNIGLIYILWRFIKRTITKLEFTFFVCYVFTVIMAVLFTQRDYYNNTMQFLFYGMLFMSYFAAKTIMMIGRLKKPFSYILIALVILLSIPNNISATLLPYGTQQIIPAQELQALAFLKKQPQGTVATSQIDESAYVALYAKKPVYIADLQQLQITHIDYKEREKQIENLHKIDPSSLPVTYFYILKTHPKYKLIKRRFASKKFKKIYENKLTVVYKNL